MNNLLRTLLFSILLAAPLCLSSQTPTEHSWGLWSSVSAEKKLAKGLNTELEIESRLRDNFKNIDKWSASVALSYRLYRNSAKTINIKTDLGYKYIDEYNPEKMTLKDIYYDINGNSHQEYNLDHKYNIAKHRLYTSLNASLSVGRIKVTLRERYQYTYNDSIQVMEDKYRFDESIGTNGAMVKKKSEMEWKGEKNIHLLRSRVGLSYDIPKCKINPYCYIELFNSINNHLALDRARYTIGGEYTYHKRHNFKLYYLYNSFIKDNDPNFSVIGISYNYEF